MARAEGAAAARIARAATAPVSSASVAFLRIAFGVAMVVNAALYLPTYVREYYVETTVHFPYGPLEVVRPLPGVGMYLVYVAMMVTGALLAAGLWSRWAAAGFFALTTYVFLLDSTFFQNHEYLISLLALLLTALPVHGRWSLDARRHPDRRRDTVPAWVVWLLRFQIGVPYFFGGIAKLNGDWLQAEPLRRWLAQRAAGGGLGEVILTNEAVVWFMAYGALVLDLAVVWLLLHRWTRVPAFVVVTIFHLLNAWLWGLWIFPWLMIVSTTIFFPPSWPEQVVAWWRGAPARAATAVAPPAPAAARPAGVPRMGPHGVLVLAAVGVWVLVQVALPLRHLAIAGSPSWTEQGHRFAWHMKLRDKTGTVTFLVSTPTGVVRVDPAADLRGKQLDRLAGHPERLRHLARHYSRQHGGAEVRAEVYVSLNGRRPQQFVDPEVDLAGASLGWHRSPRWVLPLTEPLVRG